MNDGKARDGCMEGNREGAQRPRGGKDQEEKRETERSSQHQWQILAPVDQTGLPDADCNNEENRRTITMKFQEIQRTLVEAWRPIFARWDGREKPRYSDFVERFWTIHPERADGCKEDHRSGIA